MNDLQKNYLKILKSGNLEELKEIVKNKELVTDLEEAITVSIKKPVMFIYLTKNNYIDPSKNYKRNLLYFIDSVVDLIELKESEIVFEYFYNHLKFKQYQTLCLELLSTMENNKFFLKLFECSIKENLVNEELFNKLIANSADNEALDTLEFLLTQEKWEIYDDNPALLSESLYSVDILLKSNRFNLKNYYYLSNLVFSLLENPSFDLVEEILRKNEKPLAKDFKIEILKKLRIAHTKLLLTQKISGEENYSKLMRELNNLEDFILNRKDYLGIIQEEKKLDSDLYYFYKKKIDIKILSKNVEGF